MPEETLSTPRLQTGHARVLEAVQPVTFSRKKNRTRNQPESLLDSGLSASASPRNLPSQPGHLQQYLFTHSSALHLHNTASSPLSFHRRHRRHFSPLHLILSAFPSRRSSTLLIPIDPSTSSPPLDLSAYVSKPEVALNSPLSKLADRSLPTTTLQSLPPHEYKLRHLPQA